MSGIDEQEILRRMEHLAGIEPLPGTTQVAIDRTREALIAGGRRSGSVGSVWMTRVVLRGGIAAAVLVAVGLLSLLLPHGPATAAELLSQACDKTAAYKGWVHLVVTQLPEVASAGQARLVEVVSHLNTEDGTRIDELGFEDERRIVLRSPRLKQQIEYSSKTNQILIKPLPGDTAEALASDQPTLAHLLGTLRDADGIDVLDVVQTHDGDLDKYEIHYQSSPYSSVSAAQASVEELTEEVRTVWVDPATGLIQRMRAEGPIPGETVLTYGEPVIEDIYCLGVPRDTPVVDQRPAQDVSELLDRMGRRIDEGFGDYVAVMTNTLIERNGKSADKKSLELYMQEGDAWLFCNYAVGDLQGMNRDVEILEGWPVPDVEEVLAATYHVRPYSYCVFDGERSWQINAPNAEENPKLAKESQSLGQRIWKAASSLSADSPDCRVELVVDPEHPDQSVIRSVLKSCWADEDRQEQVCRFDPARDDMPITWEWVTYDSDGITVGNISKTDYVDYGRLPNGQWYPTRWRYESQIFQKGQLYVSSTWDCRLHVYQNRRIDPAWFADPRERFAASEKTAGEQ